MLLIARNEAYQLLNWVVVVPLTTRLHDAPTMVRLTPAIDGVPQLSVANTDELQAIHVEWLDAYITHLRPERLAEVEGAIRFALALR